MAFGPLTYQGKLNFARLRDDTLRDVKQYVF